MPPSAAAPPPGRRPPRRKAALRAPSAPAVSRRAPPGPARIVMPETEPLAEIGEGNGICRRIGCGRRGLLGVAGRLDDLAHQLEGRGWRGARLRARLVSRGGRRRVLGRQGRGRHGCGSDGRLAHLDGRFGRRRRDGTRVGLQGGRLIDEHCGGSAERQQRHQAHSGDEGPLRACPLHGAAAAELERPAFRGMPLLLCGAAHRALALAAEQASQTELSTLTNVSKKTGYKAPSEPDSTRKPGGKRPDCPTGASVNSQTWIRNAVLASLKMQFLNRR